MPLEPASPTPPGRAFPAPRDPREGLRPVLLVCGLLGALVLGLFLVPRAFAMHLLDEHGPLETVSLGIYGLTGFRILRSPWFSARTRGLALAALALLVLFEVNPWGRLAHWVESPPEDPGAPGSLNLLGALAVTGVLILVFGGLAFSRGTAFLGALRAGAAEAWLAVWGVAFQALAFGFDLLQTTRFNWYRGYRMEKGIYFVSHAVEESLEFLMPVLFLSAVLLWERRQETRFAGAARNPLP